MITINIPSLLVLFVFSLGLAAAWKCFRACVKLAFIIFCVLLAIRWLGFGVF
jgi:hypothetical protein